jgi:predicted RNA methylase
MLNGRVDAEPIALLRADLTEAGYRVDVLDELWGASASAALFRGHRLPAERALAARSRRNPAGQDAAAVLAGVFVLGLPAAAAELAAALPRLGLDGARQLGLVEVAGDLARPLLDLRPYAFADQLGAGSWWIASDLGELALGGALGEEHVLGIGGASMTLSGLMVPTPAASVLDLGTGCGIQALHASRHAERVVATDISLRALELAAFNAELNDIRGIELRLGSLFDPVAGERFDRIVSNPPFVITPRRQGVPRYEYRDGGLEGDALVERVVRGAAGALAPGGVAQLLGNWEYREGEDGLDRVRSWVEGTGLDVWVIERERQDAPAYAETWIRDGGTRPGTARFDELYAAWLDDFEARGVREVGFGYVLLRRPVSGAVRLQRFERVAEQTGANPSGLGGHIAACLAAHDWLSAHGDDGLLRARVHYASDVTEERHYWPGDDDPVVMTLRQGGGFARTVSLDTALAGFVGACDGDLTVGAICAALAEVLGADAAALRTDLLPRIRPLIADAFLVPAE